MLPELIEVITTTAEKSDAQGIAAMLVDKRLAACTQVSGPIESSYWWNDRAEMSREWQVVAKTQGNLYSAVEEAIRAVHPYDEPEIMALPIVAVSAGYRQWLLQQLRLPVKGGVAEAGAVALGGGQNPPKENSPAKAPARSAKSLEREKKKG
jgi:periplasmic divalent cation tolerance protein